MYVFIDEAGNLQAPAPTHKISCVAALVVPELRSDALSEVQKRQCRRGEELTGCRSAETESFGRYAAAWMSIARARCRRSRYRGAR